jgi:AraC-like DNA-binding protein
MSPRLPLAITLDASFGLTAWCGQPQSMGAAHRHDDVELNYLVSGDAVYRFGDQQLALRAGDLCLFWAARPHQLLAGEQPPLLHWLTLPLAHFLGWGLPAQLREAVLAGAALICPHPSGAGGAGQIAGWQHDLASQSAERQAIVRLELEATLRRLWLQVADAGQRPQPLARDHGPAERMARFIVEHYQQPLTVAEIARHVGLHPHYAMQRFCRTYGVSLMTYLTHYRVARAQQLLATTERGVLEIGLEAGFGSGSRFYSAFKATCGQTPSTYRQSLRSP